MNRGEDVCDLGGEAVLLRFSSMTAPGELSTCSVVMPVRKRGYQSLCRWISKGNVFCVYYQFRVLPRSFCTRTLDSNHTNVIVVGVGGGINESKAHHKFLWVNAQAISLSTRVQLKQMNLAPFIL